MSTLEVKELSHPAGEVIKIAAGKTLDLKSQGTTALPTGSVLQVVNNEGSTEVSSTVAATWITASGTVTITPTSTSSKIHLSHVAGGLVKGDGGNISLRFKKEISGGATSYINQIDRYGYIDNGNSWVPFNFILLYLDSAGTTSSITYTIQYLQGSTVGQDIRYCDTSKFNFTAMEIQG